ncbi:MULTISPECIES: malto-oligosyltrehalose trehalohydrolase [unclassified Arthrobacter]|uniref:malto-oligosyltrehalose trehalohydrolase n=1 Tax=unclassified Arthrobacter TaxID=235627 RepID=UPI002106A29E|nr:MULTISPECIES: malto-oligosyltrehalose trehalohydrolase [unclassified Arthrobacter]MCQ1945564.1 malto-oligosyltrehalose trehalohydrolase [Arthrobacter sp. zg-Y1116]MCQ1994777.1 malto-oligosyltrehalose trehalohydrolase [Arthrobacter sp. zg-Y1171]UWX81151.1 malto-oligosyltrehalose trehalohydrolase [Arthrobacter sp. zg-Y1171]
MRTDFDVWAPKAGTVTLLADGRRLSMTRGENGWWHAQHAELTEDIDYGYLIDDAETPVPDPRSRRQPEGVHALSRTFDPDLYQWHDADWVSPGLDGGAIYEMHIGTFTPEGTLDAAIGRLDYLVDLGVRFVELLPVNAFNGTHNWGYDGVLWYAVQETYGGPEAYQRFVDAAHQAGLGVIQDVVYNHLGPSGNYLPMFGPYLTEGKANTWGDSVNLDGPLSDVVREYIVDNVLMWFRDYHVDGLRLDAVHALHDERAVHILEEMAAATDKCAEALGKPLFLIAESDLNNPRLITPRNVNGYGLAGQWSDDFHHAAHTNLTGENGGYYEDFDSLGALAKVLQEGFFHNGTYSSFRERGHGRPLDKEAVTARQLVTAIQNHDQIGNRAAGDRLSATLGYEQLALGAVLSLASPFTPMLFMGEEFGASTPWQFFTSHPEPELGKATAEGRLKEFERMGWDPDTVPNPQDPSTFTNSKLDWSEVEQGDHGRLLDLYRRLLALRRETPDLMDPDLRKVRVDYDEVGRWLVMQRGSTAVALNFADSPRELPLPFGRQAEVLLETAPAKLYGDAVQLPAYGAAILAG